MKSQDILVLLKWVSLESQELGALDRARPGVAVSFDPFSVHELGLACGPALKRDPAPTTPTELICISKSSRVWGPYRRLSGPRLVADFRVNSRQWMEIAGVPLQRRSKGWGWTVTEHRLGRAALPRRRSASGDDSTKI